MCGRMAITLPHAAMAQLFDAVPDNDLPDVPNFNVCPTVPVHVVTAVGGQRRLRAMRWGLIPRWYSRPTGGPLLINARAETVAEKPAFRDAVRQTRCLILASGYYEWVVTPDNHRLPWYITRRDGAPLVMAGIWRRWQGADTEITCCAVLTIAANETMGRIHHRMPVVLSGGDWPLWLGEAGHGAARLMRAADEDVLHCHRVEGAVNSNRAAGPDLIRPLDTG